MSVAPAHTVVPAFRRPIAALVLAASLWGGAVSGTKYALGGIGPLTLLSVELIAATTALWAVLLAQGYRPPPSWRLAGLLGLFEPALAYLGDTFGLARTSAANGAIIAGLESTLVVVLAVVLLGEAIRRATVVAIALGLLGLVVLAGGAGGHRGTVGDLCVAGGVLSAAAYTLAAKRFDDGSDPLALTAWQFAVGTTLVVPLAAIRYGTGTETNPIAVAPRFWIAALVVGVAGFGASFLLFNAVIPHVEAGRAAIVLNLIPVFGLLGATVFLHEHLSAAAGTGALLIGGSVSCFTIADHRGAREFLGDHDPL